MNPLIEKLQSRLNLLQSLTPDSNRLWGVMSPQNVIEHLGGVFYATAKGGEGKLLLAPEVAAKAKVRFFSSYYPFPKEVKMPGTQDQPTVAPPLKYSSLEEALEKLNNAAHFFLKQCEENPQQTTTHGYFGNLKMDEWVAFHIKHIEHHAMQFELLPRDEKIPELEKLLYKIKTKIHQDSPAQWGKMNAHQMVEHLGATFVFSTGKFDMPYKGSEEDANQKWEEFLKSDAPWKEVFPDINIGDPRPPRKSTIEESKHSLFKSFYKYLEYCEVNPEAVHPHLAMGDRTVDQWRLIHVKHLQHHLRQFGVEV